MKMYHLGGTMVVGLAVAYISSHIFMGVKTSFLIFVIIVFAIFKTS